MSGKVDDVDLRKIVKFSLISDTLSKKIEEMDLKSDDIIVMQLPFNYSQEDTVSLYDTIKIVIGEQYKILMFPNNISFLGMNKKELVELRNQIDELIGD